MHPFDVSLNSVVRNETYRTRCRVVSGSRNWMRIPSLRHAVSYKVLKGINLCYHYVPIVRKVATRTEGRARVASLACTMGDVVADWINTPCGHVGVALQVPFLVEQS